MAVTTIILLLIVSYWIYQNLEFLPNKTFTGKIVIGYYIHYNDKKFHFHFYLPLRNKEKSEHKEEIIHLKQLDKTVMIQRLKEKTKRIKTVIELAQFKTKYMELAPEEVDVLVKDCVKYLQSTSNQ